MYAFSFRIINISGRIDSFCELQLKSQLIQYERKRLHQSVAIRHCYSDKVCIIALVSAPRVCRKTGVTIYLL